MKNDLLEELGRELTACKRCELAKTRQNAVLGKGNADALIMLIGEAPGENEDKLAEPFIGRSGNLLTNILERAELKREDIYITNIVRCRPPDNRDPSDKEIAACKEYILRQIDIIKPEIIVTIGRIALRTLLNNDSFKKIKISDIRGNTYNFKHNGKEYKLMPTLHPAYILRNRSLIESYIGDFLKAKSQCGSQAPLER